MDRLERRIISERCTYGRGVPRDYDEAIRRFRLAAEKKNPRAQYSLGAMYQNGWGVPKDYSEAIMWYRLAAAQGSSGAQSMLGLMYQNGWGVPKDYNEAITLYRLAAEKKNPLAQTTLGLMYQNGWGVPKDYNEAISWYRLAAEQGWEEAQNNLGEMYASGRGVPQDDKAAFKWYQLAAEKGFAKAQNSLGMIYASGRGVPQDDKAAFKWYRLAAEQENPYAQNNLGDMYAIGRGVPKDNDEAVNAYRLAAGQGNADAQGKLGEMYSNGLGVPQDYVVSYMWLTVVKTNRAATMLQQTVAPKMTSAQIEFAQKMAKRCEESNYKECGEPQGGQFNISAISVPMQREGGIYVVPVLINDAITLNFIVDSGAADVSIPADVLMTLMRTGTLKETDFLEEKTYVLADGSKIPSQTFRIRSLKVGNKVLENVTGSVTAVRGSLLLGQSFLGRFKSWSIDNAKHALVIE
jgi:uncharacterized protein